MTTNYKCNCGRKRSQKQTQKKIQHTSKKKGKQLKSMSTEVQSPYRTKSKATNLEEEKKNVL